MIGWPPLSAPAASMSRSASKVTQRPCSLRAEDGGLPRAGSAGDDEQRPEHGVIRAPACGQTVCPPRGSMMTGVSQDWQ